MLNKYEQHKQKKKAVYDDMELRISKTAESAFREKAYNVTYHGTRQMLEVKINLSFLLKNIGRLDSWEEETIKRITNRLKEDKRDGI